MKNTRNVHVIRHIAFEDLGNLSHGFTKYGYNIHYHEAGMDDLCKIPADDGDILVILGGPISANNEREYPFLKDELKLLQDRLSQNKPTLGVCLGGQLIAKALGANVYPGPTKEIGWSVLELSKSGEDSPLRHFSSDKTTVLHWHGDTFDVPDGAVHLCSSEQYYNQAFSYGDFCLALQFHPEITSSGLERWFIGHTSEIHHADDISVTELRADTGKFVSALEQQCNLFLDDWLQLIQS